MKWITRWWNKMKWLECKSSVEDLILSNEFIFHSISYFHHGLFNDKRTFFTTPFRMKMIQLPEILFSVMIWENVRTKTQKTSSKIHNLLSFNFISSSFSILIQLKRKKLHLKMNCKNIVWKLSAINQFDWLKLKVSSFERMPFVVTRNQTKN